MGSHVLINNLSVLLLILIDNLSDIFHLFHPLLSKIDYWSDDFDEGTYLK